MNSPSPAPASLAHVLADPQWLCVGFNPRRRELHFLRVDSATIDRASFLDARSLDFSATTPFPLQQVHAAMPPADERAAPAFVFHNAFCCSTLLARCLPVPGRLRFLRELTVYGGLAVARDHPDSDLGADDWNAVVESVGWLSSRRFADGALSANKPTNIAVPAAADLLHAHPSARAILMYSDLPGFLVSNAKHGIAWRPRLLQMYAAMDPRGRFAQASLEEGLERLDHLQISALLWHYQMRIFGELDDRGFGARLRRLDAEDFLATPEPVVEACQRWFGITPEPVHTRALLKVEMGQHAKNTTRAYDPDQRKHETDVVMQQFGAHVNATLGWAAQRFGAWEAALPPQAPLLAPA